MVEMICVLGYFSIAALTALAMGFFHWDDGEFLFGPMILTAIFWPLGLPIYLTIVLMWAGNKLANNLRRRS